jgi:phosphoserine phosphatase
MLKKQLQTKIVFFDNDGTLTAYRVAWVYMHQWLGTWEPEGKRLLDEHIQNKTPYDEFSKKSTRLWVGISRDRFLERIRTIPVHPDIDKVVKELKGAGIKLAVLSSGFSLWKEVWLEREKIKWDYYMANDLVFDKDDRCTGEIVMNVTDNVPGTMKGDLVRKISEKEGILKDECVFTGDGRGDVPGFIECRYGIAIDPENDDVRNAAKWVLRGDEFGKVSGIILGKDL